LGPGFCTVPDSGKAAMFVRRSRFSGMGDKAVVSFYETVPLESMRRELSVLEFEGPGEEWITYIDHKRSDPRSTASHDVVYGPVAVGETSETISFYKTGFFTLAKALESFAKEKFYFQMVFGTGKALSFLKFVEAIEV
jgi:hypothetical protein